MTSEGENAANWIISKITEYAKAIKEPFSDRELHFLRLSIADFDLKDREEFLAVNSKTVRMVRDTITDEKLAGAPCVEARPGLYIPPEWKENYLKLYDSELPWLVSHCAQSAMLSEPTLEESTWWQSPRVTSGFRPSVVGQVQTNPMRTGTADQEFETLISSVVPFIVVGGLLKRFMSLIAAATGLPKVDQDIEALSRVEAVLIALSLSDFDDDVTASFAHLMIDKEILSKDVNQRESLFSKTIPGINEVFSKEKVMSMEIAQNFSLQKPTTNLMLAFSLDQTCETLGVAPMNVKLYAIKASQFAGAVATSSVFSSQTGESMNSALFYGSFLKACIDVSETPGLKAKSDEQILSEVEYMLKSNSDVNDLTNVINLNEGFFARYRDWQEEIKEICLQLVQDRFTNEAENDDEDSDPEDSYLEESNEDEGKSRSKSASARLRELNELLGEGEISIEEYNAKRNQIIDEI